MIRKLLFIFVAAATSVAGVCAQSTARGTSSCATDSLAADSIALRHSALYLRMFGAVENNVLDQFCNNEDNSSNYVYPSIMNLPVVFNNQLTKPDGIAVAVKENQAEAAAYTPLEVDDYWLRDANRLADSEYRQISQFACTHPEMVKSNIWQLPEPPKPTEIKGERRQVSMNIGNIVVQNDPNMTAVEAVKIKSWVHGFNANVQFSQAYVSSNWYQGGNSNLNLLGNFVYTFNLNEKKYPNYLFENTVQYKIGVYSTPQDSIRSYSLSEDMFQFNSKFGVKAIEKWYYSASLQFKTQFFNNYTQNTRNMKASFLSPGELNIGLGMTYNNNDTKHKTTWNLSVAPLSYNLKVCREITRMNPTNFGIDAGKHTANQFGSNLELKFSWTISPDVSWSSRLYAFSDYNYLQADWQNTLNFSVNKYLTTQIFLNLRYDSSATPDRDWKRWQFKEILSFGFTYKI